MYDEYHANIIKIEKSETDRDCVLVSLETTDGQPLGSFLILEREAEFYGYEEGTTLLVGSY